MKYFRSYEGIISHRLEEKMRFLENKSYVSISATLMEIKNSNRVVNISS